MCMEGVGHRGGAVPECEGSPEVLHPDELLVHTVLCLPGVWIFITVLGLTPGVGHHYVVLGTCMQVSL